jgi:surfactin synthase thioesterase subunit
MSLHEDIRATLNLHGRENESNTPDFILAGYLMACLMAYETATQSRDAWYGMAPEPGSLP